MSHRDSKLRISDRDGPARLDGDWIDVPPATLSSVNTDYEEFKIILADQVAREEMLSLVDLHLTDEAAADLLANEARCLMYYSKVTGLLQARVASAQQAQMQESVAKMQGGFLAVFIVVFIVIIGAVYLWWKSVGL